MKKVLLALLILGGVLAAGGIGYLLLFPQEDGENPMLVNTSVNQPQMNTRRTMDTPADVQNALDYEMSRNQDTVGWLHIAGTDINNSVLQSHDNVTYLRRNERREQDIYGCYFADYECSVGPREELSPNIVIYGHSDLTDSPDGPRFSQLFHFADETFARNTPVIQFSTLENYMNWQVFAVGYTKLDFDFISANPEGGVDKMAKTFMERSLYDYGVEVGPEDHILVLSTCTGLFGDNSSQYRFVVMAKLLPEGADYPAQAELTPLTESPKS